MPAPRPISHRDATRHVTLPRHPARRYCPRPAPLGDLRFRHLLRDDDWNRLPAAIRRRFSKRLGDARTAVYVGHTTAMSMSPLGYILTQAARLIGAPLPLSRDVGTPCIVTVTEDIATGGQIWTRQYGRRHGFPQIINSSKRFSGPTGLEEHIGYGVGMALTPFATETALIFRNHNYFITLLGHRISLPTWLSPGQLTVGHHELTDASFLFTLDLVHPWFGHLISQQSEFFEADTGSNP